MFVDFTICGIRVVHAAKLFTAEQRELGQAAALVEQHSNQLPSDILFKIARAVGTTLHARSVGQRSG